MKNIIHLFLVELSKKDYFKMSMHKSLKRNIWGAKRNVRKRYERIAKLIKEARYLKSVFNLPKEKITRLKIKKLKEEKKENTLTPSMPSILPPKKEK